MKRMPLIAAGVFVALLAVYFATRETRVSEGTRTLDLTRRIDPAKVTAVELGGFTLKKNGSDWTVAGKPADTQQVRNALEALAKVKTTEVVTLRAEKHAEYELTADKALKVKVESEGGAPVEVWFGKNARNGGLYARLPDSDAVFVVPGTLSWQLHRNADEWRNKRFVSFKADDVTALTVKPVADAAYSLKKDGTEWKLGDGVTPPAGFRFDARAASSIPSQLSYLTAQAFADHVDDEWFGLAGAHDVVEAELSGGKKVTLHFGRRPDNDEQTAARELRTQFDTVDAAEKKDDRVTVEDLKKVAADTAKPESLRKIAERLANDPKAFARLDVGVYAATPKDDAVTRGDLDGANRTASLVPVRMDGDAQVYLVPGYSVAAVTKKLSDLRDLSLFNFDADKVTKLELHSGATHVVVEKDGTSWKLTEPKKLPDGFEFDPSTVSMQLASFRALRALKLAEASVTNDAQAGLTRPVATIEVTLEGGVKQAVKLGKTTEGGLYARGAVDEAIYVVSTSEKSRIERGVELFKKRPPPSFAGSGFDQLPPDLRAKLEASLKQQAH
ncbi:MAG: DUF4340 domain-containing protein [Myxococcaceae bacterium]|nr:DUF4340 domain-containing protein [Myxococcaceae bacterium]